MGLNTKVVACAVTVGNRFHNPVNAETEFIHKFTNNGGNFSRIDTIGAEQRTAAAFRALVCVREKLFDNIFIHRSCTGDFAQNFTGKGKIFTVNGAQKFCTQYGHIFGIIGAEEEVAFISTRTAAHTSIHENF